jgi:hypothetical protein
VTKQAGKPDLNWAQAGGSALAALSSAVLLSTLGATGTLVGAAIGSVVVTLGGTVYSHYLSASRERMAAARGAALLRASRVRGGPRTTSTRTTSTRTRGTSRRGSLQAAAATVTQSPETYPLLSASARSARGTQLVDGKVPSTSWREALRGLRWRHALAASLGVFLLVMGVIVSMELVTGRALSSYTGGSGADGPRTSISLLASTGGEDGRGGSRSTETTDRTGTHDSTAEGRSDGGADDTADSGAGARSAVDAPGGSADGATSDADAPRSDTSTADPDTAAPTEPVPEPTTTPSPQSPTQAPAEAPAPSTGAAVGGAAAQPVS